MGNNEQEVGRSHQFELNTGKTIHCMVPILLVGEYRSQILLDLVSESKVFLPPESVGKVIESVPSACLSISTLTAEPFDIRTKYFMWSSAWTISRSSPMGKVIGQMLRSQGQKTWFPGFWFGTSIYNQYSLWCDIMTFVLWISMSILHGKRTFRQKDCAWGERERFCEYY